MTKTEQARSLARLDKTGGNSTVQKPGTEVNIKPLLSLFDSMNNYHKALFKLNYELAVLEQTILSQRRK